MREKAEKRGEYIYINIDTTTVEWWRGNNIILRLNVYIFEFRLIRRIHVYFIGIYYIKLSMRGMLIIVHIFAALHNEY